MQERGVMILAGDIGGTHTRLALFSKGKRVGKEQKFTSRKYASLGQIVQEFLGTTKVDRACFGIAGPVREGKCKATNLPWEVDAEKLSVELGISWIILLNDLEANAYGLSVVDGKELYLLHKGVSQKGNQALIAAGTGLGEAGPFWDGEGPHPFAGEGG